MFGELARLEGLQLQCMCRLGSRHFGHVHAVEPLTSICLMEDTHRQEEGEGVVLGRGFCMSFTHIT